MKKNLFTFIILLQSITCFPQTKADYEYVVTKIGKCYNLMQADSLLNMYSAKTAKSEKSIWTRKEIEDIRIRNGRMVTYEYAGEKDGITFYRIEFSRSKFIMGLALDNENKLTLFQFKMSSPYTDSLLEQN